MPNSIVMLGLRSVESVSNPGGDIDLVPSGAITITPDDAAKTITIHAPPAAAVPVGTIVAYGGSVAPDGWLLCDGSEVSRTTYADLFGVIGTTYGAGDGSTTFNLPNLQARIPVGLHPANAPFDTLGKTGGSETQTLAVENLPSHSHTFSGTTSTAGAHVHNLSCEGGPWGATYSVALTGGLNPQLLSGLTDNQGAHSHTFSGTTDATGSGSAFSVMNPYLVVNYIIKY